VEHASLRRWQIQNISALNAAQKTLKTWRETSDMAVVAAVSVIAADKIQQILQ
jgi:hypothetical protein